MPSSINTVTVAYSTTDSTAVHGADYTAQTGTLFVRGGGILGAQVQRIGGAHQELLERLRLPHRAFDAAVAVRTHRSSARGVITLL